MGKKEYIFAVLLAVVLALAITGMIFSLVKYSGKSTLKIESESGHYINDDPEDNKSGSGISVTRSKELIEAENNELLEVYKTMKEDNPDFTGYVRIAGTQIEYPVMYTPYDPEKYLHMDLNGVYSEDGMPFIDGRCSVDPDSDNIIIYGHNMKDGSMFASLMSYQDKAYFEAHPKIHFDTENEIREYDVMAVFYDRVYYEDEDVFKFYNFIDAKDKADFEENVKQYLKKSVYDTGVTAEYEDKLVTLVTCAYHTENGRFVVIARRKDSK